MIRCARLFAILLLACLMGAPLVAQTTGNLDGRVTDLEGQMALPGVQVIIQSPALQGNRTAFTDGDGRFSFRGLPPGTYQLEASLDGFGSFVQTDVRVGLDRTVTLPIEMTAAIQEVVTVTGGAPVVDVTTTTAGANFSDELIEALPTARTFQSLAFLAPSVVGGGLGSNPSIGGASAAENRYIIDGLDTTDPAYGTVGSDVTMEFIQEVQVKTGGYEAEYGGALGGIINMVTKSGGNEFHGDVFAYYTNDGLQADARDVALSGERDGYDEYDYGFDVGGKIIQDRLWYFLALNPSIVKTDFTLLQGQQLTRTWDELYYAGKLTWQATDSAQVVASVFGDPTNTDQSPSLSAMGVVTNEYEFGASSYGLTGNLLAGDDFFFEVAVGRYDQTDRTTPATDAPVYVDSVDYRALDGGGSPRDRLRYAERYCGELTELRNQDLNGDGQPDGAAALPASLTFHTGCSGGTFVVEDGDRMRDNLRGSTTWFAGDHEIKGGFDYREVEFRDHAHYPGSLGGPVLDPFGDVIIEDGFAGRIYDLLSPMTYQISDYDQNSTGRTDEFALYLQDQWQLTRHLTLKFGVRADQYTSEGDATGTTENLQALDFGLGDTLAPRLGLVWDPAGTGRSKIYGHWGRFYESVPLDINVRAFGNEKFIFYQFELEEPIHEGGLPGANNVGYLAGLTEFGTATAVDPDIKPMYSEEWALGGEYEILRNLAVGVKYVRKEVGDVIEDISVDGGASYFITNPGGTLTENPVTGDDLGFAVEFPEAERDYEAWEFTFQKRLDDNWQLAGSYVWSENIGNYGGLFRQDNGQLDPNITSLFDLPELLDGAYGLLPNDRTHVGRLYGSYGFNFGLVAGFTAEYLTGTPISKMGSHSLYGINERFVEPRGSAGRTPDIWSADLHVEYPIRLGRGGLTLKLIGDVFNVTDEQEATTVDQMWTTASELSVDDPTTPEDEGPDCGGADELCVSGNPTWGLPTSYQTPRIIRVAFKVSW